MGINPFVEAREKLPSAISTLPPGYLNGNAAALLAIVEELKNSYKVELKVIQAIKNLDVANPDAVAQLAVYLEDYYQDRDFDQERTHCHNIDRIARTLLVPLQAGAQADRERVTEVEQQLLAPLRAADNDFLDDLEPLLARALAAIRAINSHAQASRTDASRLDTARQEQQAFVQEFAPHVDQLKKVLKQINTLSNDLIDRL